MIDKNSNVIELTYWWDYLQNLHFYANKIQSIHQWNCNHKKFHRQNSLCEHNKSQCSCLFSDHDNIREKKTIFLKTQESFQKCIRAFKWFQTFVLDKLIYLDQFTFNRNAINAYRFDGTLCGRTRLELKAKA